MPGRPGGPSTAARARRRCRPAPGSAARAGGRRLSLAGVTARCCRLISSSCQGGRRTGRTIATGRSPYMQTPGKYSSAAYSIGNRHRDRGRRPARTQLLADHRRAAGPNVHGEQLGPIQPERTAAWCGQWPYRDAAGSRDAITFAFVATHNHFVLDRGGKVFKQYGAGDQAAGGGERGRAPGAARRAQLVGSLLLAEAGLPRQGRTAGVRRGSCQDEPWEEFYEFTGTKLAAISRFPSVCRSTSAASSTASPSCLAAQEPSAVCDRTRPHPRRPRRRPRRATPPCAERMIALQEELDWTVYRAYDLHHRAEA